MKLRYFLRNDELANEISPRIMFLQFVHLHIDLLCIFFSIFNGFYLGVIVTDIWSIYIYPLLEYASIIIIAEEYKV